MLAAGVAGLLMFNTNMQQTSFTATALQHQANALDRPRAVADDGPRALRNPQRLAVAAKKLGMVPPSQPAFVRLSDGKVLGAPLPATGRRRHTDQPAADRQADASLEAEDADRQGAVPPKAQGGARQPRQSDTRGASTAGTREGDRKKGNAPSVRVRSNH